MLSPEQRVCGRLLFALRFDLGLDACDFCFQRRDAVFQFRERQALQIIADEDYDRVGFTTLLGLKDISLALAAGDQVRVPMPSANVCRDRLLGAAAHGDSEKDWAVMAREQARAAGLE